MPFTWRWTGGLVCFTGKYETEHRNVAVFYNARPSVTSLFDIIRAEALQWAEAQLILPYSPRLGLWVELYGTVLIFLWTCTYKLLFLSMHRNARL
jgi:hypothetical protein